MSNLILQEHEMRTEFVTVFNKWINELPAFAIAPVLNTLHERAMQAYKVQYQQELDKLSESKEVKDGKETNNQ